ncbi:helicase HerA-like domain-containing protein [Bdellovibrio sp. HCB2-146]|uniref:helicase HerA-like domain-containing protein n=1 Tax=Bdellovibrio sp. HCB2-146 TaxID=3394362 RepID=UPI0039BCC3BD
MVDKRILIGRGEEPCYLLGRYSNRHGLIAGATGTGKTVSLQVLAEGFSDLGVPVFLADIKGDLAGLSQAGESAKLKERALSLGIENYQNKAYPVIFWDVLGEQGHPVRSTVSEMGPMLLARLMGLNDTQIGVLNVVFKYADDNGFLILDLKDLKSILNFAAENITSLGDEYGTITKQSVGVVQRELLTLESEGASEFFGEPSIKVQDFIRTTIDGRGHINILAADKIYQKPTLYATFLLWLLSELFENLSEQGDQELPKMIFFFDEAHLLFNDAPKALLEKVEQVVRLIRSKGVGVYFISQSPLDIPEKILGQLGNRIQHALRAFTPKDQKAVKTAAETFRAKPGVNVVTAITELGVGEALISMLTEGGVPAPVERAKVCPPQSRIGAITNEERQAVMARSPFKGQYEQAVDRESAYEKLEAQRHIEHREEEKKAKPKKEPDTMWEIATKSAVRAASSKMGREIGQSLLRGILGSLTKKH